MSRMFALGVIFLLSCCMSQSMQCDLTKEHPVIDKTSNKTLRCMKCKTCKPGKELKIPCGTPVGRFEQVGDCRPCKNGTYSATEDSRECQVCRSEKCFKHQVIEGTCLANQRDETYCIEKCVNGYVMNKEGTACEVLTPQQNTPTNPTTSNPTTSNPTTSNPTTSNPTTSNPTTSNPTTSNPTTSNPTTSNPTTSDPTTSDPTTSDPTTSDPTTSDPTTSDPTTSDPTTSDPTTSDPKEKKLTTNSYHTTNQPRKPGFTTKQLVVSNNQKDKMAVPFIVVTVILVFAFIVVIICKCIWPRLKIMLQTREPRGEKFEDEELLDVTDTTRVKGLQDEPVREEESFETDLPEANGPPPCPENNDGFDSTRNASAHVGHDITVIPNPVVSNIVDVTNMAYMSSTPPPRNDSVVLEIPVQSPAQMVFEPLRQPQVMVPGRQPPFAPNQIAPPMHNFNHPDPTRFDCYPVDLYSKICHRFDTGPPFQDAMALAGWLDITVNQNRAFEKKENKTDLIIKSWMERRGNTVATFIQILNDHGMTRLADEINACRLRLMAVIGEQEIL